VTATRITGLDDMRKAFGEVGQEIEKGPLQRVVRRFGNSTAKRAAALAPEDEGVLKKGIKAKSLRKRDAEKAGFAFASHVAARGLTKIAKQMTPNLDPPPANYGAMVEIGTEVNKAKPHLRPAANELASGLEGKVRSGMAADIERIKRKAARLRARSA